MVPEMKSAKTRLASTMRSRTKWKGGSNRAWSLDSAGVDCSFLGLDSAAGLGLGRLGNRRTLEQRGDCALRCKIFEGGGGLCQCVDVIGFKTCGCWNQVIAAANDESTTAHRRGKG